MNISLETTGNLGRRLTISVPSETFEGQITQRLGAAAGQVRLPGFRPGKVPMKEVRRRFGPSVRAEVASELMQSSFVDAISQESIAPAGAPNLEVVKMDPGIDFEFTATFEVFPNVALADFSTVTIERPEAGVTAADLDAMSEKLREQRATYEPVERAAADGDQVVIDFRGSRDGEVIAGGEGEGVEFVLGQGQMIADFDANTRGLSAGESKTFTAVFPDDYHAEELQGASVEFAVTVTEVREHRVPELDTEFFTEFGVEDATLEAFREEVRGNMEREMATAVTTAVKGQVQTELQRLHTLQLPEALVLKEIDALRQNMMQQMQMYGRGQALPEIDGELFREEAQKRVTVGLVMNEIATTHSIEADADQVRARIEEMAQPYAQPEQVVNYYYSNEEQLQQVEMAVIEDQVIDHILESARITPVTSSYDAIVSGTALTAPEDPSEQRADGGGSSSSSSGVEDVEDVEDVTDATDTTQTTDTTDSKEAADADGSSAA